MLEERYWHTWTSGSGSPTDDKFDCTDVKSHIGHPHSSFTRIHRHCRSHPPSYRVCQHHLGARMHLLSALYLENFGGSHRIDCTIRTISFQLFPGTADNVFCAIRRFQIIAVPPIWAVEVCVFERSLLSVATGQHQ